MAGFATLFYPYRLKGGNPTMDALLEGLFHNIVTTITGLIGYLYGSFNSRLSYGLSNGTGNKYCQDNQYKKR
jgi:hypothetical protein